MDNGFIYLAIVLCLVMLSISAVRRSHQRQATARDLTREQLARLRDQTRVQGSMEDLIIQLEEVSRRVNAQVDTKFAKLEAVVRDADQRIARLEKLLGRPASASSAGPEPPGERFEAGLAPAPPKPPAPEVAPPPTVDGAASSESGAFPETRTERRQRIYELADKGTTPMTIADLLQMPLGEVELILNLRSYK